MAINKNNFLRWVGSWTKQIPTFTTDVAYFNLYANEDFTIVQPMSLCSASLGIALNSFKIIDVLAAPLGISRDFEYDGIGNLKVYRPYSTLTTGITIYFTFEDYSGNLSPVTQCNISVDSIYVSWEVYPTSATCTLDAFGNNTGYQYFTQLVLVNSATSTYIIPLTLKDNAVSDADYIAPVQNVSSCPVSGSSGYGYLFINNTSKNGSDVENYITITNIYLYSATLGAGGTPLTVNQNCFIQNNATLRLFVPSGAWDNIAISYIVNGNMATAIPLRYWFANLNGNIIGFGPSGSGTGDNPVDNSGILSGIGITIPVSTNGITIFAR